MSEANIAAVVLAAGLSRRMGQPKLVMPWGNTSVIGRVVDVLSTASLQEIVVVTGGAARQVEAVLRDRPARVIFNESYLQDDMAVSLQVGLAALQDDVSAALVVLGDQPQIEREVVRAVITTYLETGALLVAPSYQMRRGHPWLMDCSFWPRVRELSPPSTLRDLLKTQAASIHYLVVDRPSVLLDLDTPEDYARQAPIK